MERVYDLWMIVDSSLRVGIEVIKGCERGLLWNFERSQACSGDLEMEQDSGTEEIPRKVLGKLTCS